MYRSFVRRNITSFVIIFCAIQMVAPHFLYNEDGSLRQFGIGYKKKTVIPNWLVALILAIFSYLFVLAAAAFLCAVGISQSISNNALNVVDIANAPVSRYHIISAIASFALTNIHNLL